MKTLQLLGVLGTCCLLWTCTPWNLNEKEFLRVQIGFLDGVDKERVELRSTVSSLNRSNSELPLFVKSHGYVFDTDTNMLALGSASKIVSFSPAQSWDGEHRGIIEGFQGMTNYYAVAYAETEENVFYSDTITFSTHWKKLSYTLPNMGIFWGSVHFVLGQSVYLGFWHPENNNPLFFLRINPETGSNGFLTNPFPGPGVLLETYPFAIDGKGYIAFGGFSESVLFNDLYAYDPITEEWQQKATHFNGAGRRFGTSLTIDGKAYFVGSWHNESGDFNTEVLEYNPLTDSLRPMDPFPEGPPWHQLGFELDGLGYVYAQPTDFDEYGYFYQFNPNAPTGQQWLPLPNFIPPGDPDIWRLATKIDGEVYLGLGIGSSNTLYTDFYKLNPDSFTWTRMDFPGVNRNQTNLISVNGKAYVIGGYFHTNPEAVDVYQEQTPLDIWEFTP